MISALRTEGEKRREKIRVLLVNEPCSYRETIAATLQALRPETNIVAAGSKELCSEMTTFLSHLVIGSRLPFRVKAAVVGWIELYPEHGSLSEVALGGECSTQRDMQLADLLSAIDWVRKSVTQEAPRSEPRGL